ncbi:MAG: exopolyphosphatase [Planctomycetes bacterium]|nr:exopolyphosphatase [Planctomycetota bacterium]
MKILTRGDLDGLTSTVLITIAESVTEMRFAHPKDVQDGKVKVDKDDIIVNLPFVPGCGKWFDHHVSEEQKLEKQGKFDGAFAVAPSAARVVYGYYKKHQAEFDKFKELLEATDRLDSAQLTKDEVEKPTGWILLGLTLDPRTGLGPEFQKYFRWLADYIKEVPLGKILQHPEVKKRTDRVMKEQEDFKKILQANSKADGNVVITDLRGKKDLPVGNRFLVFALFPQCNIEARIFNGHAGQTVIAAGASIFNRTCNVNIGNLLAQYGGGGHQGAGTAQLAPDKAEAQMKEILGKLKANKK